VRRPLWSCIVHRPPSLSVRGRPSFIAHRSAVVVSYPSWLVDVGRRLSVVHHRRSSIHPPSSLLVRHRVIGRLSPNAHRLSPVVRRWSPSIIVGRLSPAPCCPSHRPSPVACRPSLAGRYPSSCVVRRRWSCIVGRRRWSSSGLFQ
jgi:hypothetical protein